MKSLVCFLTFAVLLFGFAPAMYAQGAETEGDYYTDGFAEDDDAADDTAVSDGKPFLTFNEGLAAAWLTRTITQTEEADFVFKDFLLGLYFNVDLQNVKYIIPTIRLAAYYPLTSSLNDEPQKPDNPAHFGIDLLAGVKVKAIDAGYLSVSLGAAFHMLFLTSDRWNYLNLGGAALVGIEVPLAKNWTVLIGGNASLDYGNLGNNRLMEPFDNTWQYQIDLGVRYSKKKRNTTTLFDNIPEFSLFDTEKNKSNGKPDQIDYYDDY